MVLVILLGLLCLGYSSCQKCPWTTTAFGTPRSHKDAVLTVGSRGPMVLEDTEFLDELAHFDHERIPPRVVHAKGVGAAGYFEVTKDITKYSAAKMFSTIGKRTPLYCRFSSVAADHGSPDTTIDIRGFALKFYTEDGIWDLLGNNMPVFFVRDPMLFPSNIHILKRDPTTNLRNATIKWDFFTLRPESVHTILWMYSDRGLPYSLRHMNGYGVNTFKLVNSRSNYVYCKFHYISNQGLKNLTKSEAVRIRSYDPDYYQRDMFESIAKGDYPSWTFYIQVMTQEQADSADFNPFDDTKVWDEKKYPLIEVGRFVLTRNPENYFEEVEQLGFDPSNLVPGIGASPDKMLQGRLFAYSDTQRYRLGPNYLQLPVNRPFCIRNYERDGKMVFYNQGSAPNYYPNSFGGPNGSYLTSFLTPPYRVAGLVDRYEAKEEDDFSQATNYYRNELDESAKERLIDNLVDDIRQIPVFIQKRAIKMFSKVDRSLAKGIKEKLNK